MSSKLLSLLFVWGTLKSAFTGQMARSQILASLWKTSKGQTINSTGTLPLSISSKDEIFQRIAHDQGAKAPLLKMRQGFGYAKELVKFYKHGISVVWENNKKVRQIRRTKYKIDGQLDRKGDETAISLPSFTEVTKVMAQALYMNFVENKTSAEHTKSDVVRTDQQAPKLVGDGLFLLTRAEYQLLNRTPGDFAKIPLFAVLATIFVEMTPVLCYVFPEVTPSTCVLPSILPRIWNVKASKKLQKTVTAESVGLLDDYAVKTAYNLPVEHVYLLVETLRLKSKYIPLSLYPEKVLRNRLQDYYNYLTVDNYYLSGLNGDGNLWGLDNLELVLACLERNLIEDLNAFVKVQSLGLAEAKVEELEKLRLKLFQSIANFQTSNIGYLAMGHLLPQPKEGVVASWRK